jgi:hypothetical protein
VETAKCEGVCSYIQNAGFDIKGLSGEVALVLIFLISIVHLIEGILTLNISSNWLMVFVSAYVLRFLMLFILITFKLLLERSIADLN